jgi:PAS domain S-box-containing protein
VETFAHLTKEDLIRLLRDLRRQRSELQSREIDWPQAQGHKTAQERASNLYDSAPVALLTLDREGAISNLNLTASALLGRSRTELLGQPLGRLLAPGTQADLAVHLHQAFVLREPTTGRLRLQPDANRPVRDLRVDSRVSNDLDGEERCLSALIDITETVQRERDLRRLRLAVEQSADGINITDMDGMILYANPASESIYGYALGELSEKHVCVLNAEPETSTAIIIPAVRSTGHWSGDLIQKRKDGSCFDAHLSASLVEMDGATVGMLGVIRDVTEERRVEQALATAKDEAERANLGKSQFLAAANHDLRQPLQAIRLLLESLTLRKPDPKTQEVLDDMTLAVHAMDGLLNALLDIGKLDSGGVVPARQDFRAAPFLHRLRIQFKTTAREAGKSIRLFPSDAVLHTDPVLLARILQNFISNAVRHTRGDAILVGVRRVGSSRRIEVWDTGEGIEPEQRELIFGDFYQIGNPARNAKQGIGLGLAIAKRMADLLKSPISVRSWPGKGSVFAVDVPAGEETYREPLAQPHNPAARDDRSGLILVVDDNPLVLKATRKLLEALRYQVLSAASAEEALELVERHAQDIWFAVLDYRLSNDWTGVGLIQHIRRQLDRDIPGVLISGDTCLQDVAEVRLSGMPVLQKPMDPDLLLQHLHRTFFARRPSQN